MPKVLIVVIAGLLTSPLFAATPAPEKDAAPYEMWVMKAKPGKLDQLHAWFRAHQDDVLAKHGATTLAFLVPAGENLPGTLVGVIECPNSLELRRLHEALPTDPLWKPLDTNNDSPERLVDTMERVRLTETDYSPDFVPGKAAEPRVFELRTYTCPSPERLTALHERFRTHTTKLFAKHGMENLIYWQPSGTRGSDVTLIYLLGHQSVDAAKGSFAAFRKDPDWLAAKKASEEKAGGSLTNPENGVVSEFFIATDYSPLQ